MFIEYLERERERDASCKCSDWGSNPQPSYVPWPGVKLATFPCMGRWSNNGATQSVLQHLFSMLNKTFLDSNQILGTQRSHWNAFRYSFDWQKLTPNLKYWDFLLNGEEFDIFFVKGNISMIWIHQFPRGTGMHQRGSLAYVPEGKECS